MLDVGVLESWSISQVCVPTFMMVVFSNSMQVMTCIYEYFCHNITKGLIVQDVWSTRLFYGIFVGR